MARSMDSKGMTTKGVRHVTLGAVAVAASLSAGAALAQDAFPNPSRQVRVVVPFTAGGSSDVQARMLADKLGRLWNQPVVVENKPGAGGHLGGKYVVDQPADGYTLMVGSIGLHATYGVYSKLTYNPGQDLLVVRSEADEHLVPFVTELVPVVDLATGVVEVVDLPGLFEPAPSQEGR